MDHPIPRPLGLAALITATVTLFSPMGIDSSRGGLASQSLADKTVMALHSPQPALHNNWRNRWQNSKPIGPQAEPPQELPADIRTARLMLSVESLFKATTTN